MNLKKDTFVKGDCRFKQSSSREIENVEEGVNNRLKIHLFSGP